MRVPFNYLPEQFADPEPYIAEWRRLITSSEFTIGPFVEDFERKFAAFVGTRHCVSTNNGTDALMLALKAAGVSAGDRPGASKHSARKSHDRRRRRAEPD